MTEQVRVSGHNIPPVPADAVVNQHSREGGGNAPAPAPQPQHNPYVNLQPGFVPQNQPPAPQAPAPAPTPAPAADPTITALLAALSGQAPAPAAAPAAAPAPVGNGLEGAVSASLSAAGVDVNRAIEKALEYGDASLVDVAYITEKGGANSAHLVALAQALVAQKTEASLAMENAVYQLSGGEANWNAATALFQQKAPPYMNQTVKAMFDSGNKESAVAAAKLVVEFARTNGGTVTPAGLVIGSGAVGAQHGLSKIQFQAELQKLNRNAAGYEQARGELIGRRSIGKNQGL